MNESGKGKRRRKRGGEKTLTQGRKRRKKREFDDREQEDERLEIWLKGRTSLALFLEGDGLKGRKGGKVELC